MIDELSTQDIRVRTTTTLIDCRIGCFANRSHGQRIVVKKDVLMKARSQRIVASKKTIKSMWNVLKIRERNFALITTHAKLGIDVRGVGKSFSFPIKSMAKGTFDNHLSKTMNLPSRIKRLASDGKVQMRLW